MAVEVKVYDLKLIDLLPIVAELKTAGLILNQDFEFAYHPPKWDNVNYEETQRRHVVFKFYAERHATFFALKYSN
jgi:hypothetical protein